MCRVCSCEIYGNDLGHARGLEAVAVGFALMVVVVPCEILQLCDSCF